jgi:CHAD domain-containing protein
MKARKVKKLDPEMPLADAAERILRVRIDELYSFTPRALDPREERALHDMRIAAKRLRYLLELTAPCFGSYAATGAKRAKQLQDLLGEIHDCDVMLPLVREHLETLRTGDAAEVRRLAGDAEDLDAGLPARAPHRRSYRGLEILIVHLQARRDLLFERFLERWKALQRRGFRARLEQALADRAPARTTRRPVLDPDAGRLRAVPTRGERRLRDAAVGRARDLPRRVTDPVAPDGE